MGDGKPSKQWVSDEHIPVYIGMDNIIDIGGFFRIVDADNYIDYYKYEGNGIWLFMSEVKPWVENLFN